MKTILQFFLLLYALPACAGWDFVELKTPHPQSFGPMHVGHDSVLAIDSERGDREIYADIWYPVDEVDADPEYLHPIFNIVVSRPRVQYPLLGAFGISAEVAYIDWPVSSKKWRPLIIFSHGYGAINTQSTTLMETLASHGFIVVAPEHTGNTATGPQDPHDIAAANRVPDVSFIIDYMLARSGDPESSFYRRINPFQIGVVGHSFGGTTALGMTAGFAGAEADNRVRAIVPISAVVANRFSEQQLADIHVPVMLIGGTEDSAVPIENNTLAFDTIPAIRPVYRADILGAVHTHFANVCSIGYWLLDHGITINRWSLLGAGALIGPFNETCTESAFPIAEAIRLQNLYTVAFFKRHLQYDLRYGHYLTKNYSQINEADVIFDKKRNKHRPHWWR